MLEFLANHIPGLLWNVFFWGVFIRGIFSTDISNWLRHKGLVREKEKGYTWKVLDFFYEAIVGMRSFIKNKILSTERKQIFWQHETEQHRTSLNVCTKGSCSQLDAL